MEVAPTPVASVSPPIAVVLVCVACDASPSAIDNPAEAVVRSLDSIVPSPLRSIAPPIAVELLAEAIELEPRANACVPVDEEPAEASKPMATDFPPAASAPNPAAVLYEPLALVSAPNAVAEPAA